MRRARLATFASEAAGGCLFEFMPVEGRLNFLRNTDRHAKRPRRPVAVASAVGKPPLACTA
jgi:hypothetical protein